MRAAADDDAELGLVVDATDTGRQQDRPAGPDHGRGRLDEDQRLSRQRLVQLGRMILVVQTDADDL